MGKRSAGFSEVAHLDEGVFDLLVGDAVLVQLAGQPVVSVEVELQTERGPRGNAKIAKAELLVDEVDIVVQASSAVVLEERGMSLLVVPRLKGRACFHGGEDVNDARMITTLDEDVFDALFFAEILLLTHEFDFDAVVGRDLFDVFPDLIAHGRSPVLEVEDANLVSVKPVRDRAGMTDVGKCSLKDDAIKTRQHPVDVVGMALEEVGHNEEPREVDVVPQIWLTYSSNDHPCMVPACPG